MKKDKLKIGDRVQLSEECADWYTDHAKDIYTVDDKYDGRCDTELVALFASRLYNDCELIGKVLQLNDKDKTAHVDFANFWGSCVFWVDNKHLTKIKRKKAKK